MDAIAHIAPQLARVADPVALLRQLVAWSPVAYQLFDLQGRSVLNNAAHARLFGSSPPPEYSLFRDELIEKNGILALIRQAYAGEIVHTPPVWYDPRELRHVDVPEGRRVAVDATFVPLFDAQGRVEYVLFVFRDRTDEMLALEAAERDRAALEAERDVLRAVIDQSGDGILVADPQGMIRIYNPAAERQHGVPVQHVPPEESARAYGLLDDEGAPLALEQIPLFRALGGDRVEGARWKVRRPDGAVRTLSGTATPLRGPDGSVTGAVLTTRDETERVAAEAERAELAGRLAHADRLAAMGQLAAGVAHEINNPSTVVLGNLELLMRMGDRLAPERQRQMLESSVQAMQRISRITRSLLTFGRLEPARVEAVDVRESVALAATLVENELRHRARLVLDIAPVPPITGDGSRIGQILTNLLLNAAQAIQPGRVDENEVRVEVRHVEQAVRIAVSDTGAGVPDELRDRIFDPFFTTKSRGAGTGLGLSLSAEMARQHGGTLRLCPSERGACFELILPLGTEAPYRAARPPTHVTVERLRVLLVDDEPQLVETVAAALGTVHDVVRAAGGIEACGILDGDAGFDVVLCDLMMPDLSGMAVWERVRERDPALASRFVFMTGGAFTPAVRAFLGRTQQPVLEKPFPLDELDEVLAAFSRRG